LNWAPPKYKSEVLLCTIWGPHSSGYEQFYVLIYNAI
jgi:hypothetical protein